MKKIAILALLAALAGGGFYAYRRHATTAETAVRYESVDLRRQDLTVRIEATAAVRPRNRIEIKPPINGRIDDVLVDEGAAVTKGQLIGRMSSTERATLLDAARAKGDDVFRKWEDAYKPTPLIAPLDGTIIARDAEPGQTVTAADVVLVLSDRLIVTAQVDETDIAQIRVGQAARVTLDAYPDVVVTGKVRHVAFEAKTVNNVTVYEVDVDPDTIPDVMKSGMTASVGFEVAAARDVLTVPSDAVTLENGKSIVLLEGQQPNAAPEPSRVLTGLAADGRVEILAGLEGDERVVRKAFSAPDRKDDATSPFMPQRRR